LIFWNIVCKWPTKIHEFLHHIDVDDPDFEKGFEI
jgi:hypothetical protein